MSNNKTSLSARSIKMLQSIGRDYLVEVFRPRNCYEQDWADIDTFQFRLESQDLLIGRVIDQENGCEEWGDMRWI